MTLGANNDDLQKFDGSISNFKLYDVALTAEEVAMEYALGRTGKSLNLTDTSLCLGGTVPRAQLDVRGGARFDGRVGIGSLSPTGQLQITSSTSGGVNADTMDTQLVLASTGDNYNPGNVGAGIMFAQRWWNNASSVAGCCGIYSVKRSGNGSYGGDMAFYTGPPSGNYNMTEKMRIMSSGNVGIGTTSPSVKLDVNGSMSVSNLPRWRANYGTSYGDLTSTGTIKWSNTDVDNKSGYSSSTGLYTAQEAGHYYVYCHMYTKSGDTDAEICFIINGNSGSPVVGSAYSRAGESGYTNLVLMTNLDLNVNDTIGVRINLAAVHYNSRGISYFGGYKVC
jgi:hypothetical protein